MNLAKFFLVPLLLMTLGTSGAFSTPPAFGPAPGEPPIYAAIRKGDSALVDRVISQGANVNTTEYGSKVTPLEYAVMASNDRAGWVADQSMPSQDSLKIIKSLVNAGANPNAPDIHKQTPLNVAINPGLNTEVVRYLLSLPKIDLTFKDRREMTPLQLANSTMEEFIKAYNEGHASAVELNAIKNIVALLIQRQSMNK